MHFAFAGFLPACLLVAAAIALLWSFRPGRKRLQPTHHRKDSFIVQPYLQLGNAPFQVIFDQLDIVWCAPDAEGTWSVETRHVGASEWRTAQRPEVRRIGLVATPAFYRFKSTVKSLAPGAKFDYRVRKDGQVVFAAQGLARKSALQPYRFVIFGDHAVGGHGSKEIAYRAWLEQPDFVFVAGDIVYKRGRISEYLENFFPVLNADNPSPENGGSLLRSRVFLGAAGNHDVGTPDNWDVRDFGEYPDLLGFYLFWSLPANGPALTAGGANTPLLVGDSARIDAFLQAAYDSYPRSASYSFDYANAHWTVIDANNYMDWTDEKLRAWLDNDLSSAKESVWKFVCFHQPSFSSDAKHWREQRMRLVADILQKHGVDMVFSGHHHAYERTYPLRFNIQPQPDGKLIAPDGQVSGQFVLDKTFDGATNTRADGIIYIVTGAAGAPLNKVNDAVAPITQRPFTFKLDSDKHSFTACDVDGRKLTVRQIAHDGTLIDSFVLTK